MGGTVPVVLGRDLPAGGEPNTLADCLNREFVHHHDWSLNAVYLNEIFAYCGLPDVDRIASTAYASFPWYMSRFWDAEALAQDALVMSWNLRMVYVFPPLPLVLWVVLKIQAEHVTAIAIIPWWPRRPWFPIAFGHECNGSHSIVSGAESSSAGAALTSQFHAAPIDILEFKR